VEQTRAVMFTKTGTDALSYAHSENEKKSAFAYGKVFAKRKKKAKAQRPPRNCNATIE
jgi:hypothetical protein